MNVVCMRCNTRYEFDDALVSSRGTSVKCTNCGHKFRVHPPAGKAAQPDQWIIRKASGMTQRFGSLRELQRALHEGSVTITDEISRDGSTYRPIHAVPELESFFPRTALGAPVPGTVMGVNSPQRPTPIPRPARETAPAPPLADDEEEQTAVYSHEQLNKLRPMRSAPPPATSRIPTSERRAGGPTLSRAPVVKSPIQGPSHAGAPAAARAGQAGAVASALPPIIPRPGDIGAGVPAAIPIAAPAGSAPLPGTPTISVTGPKPPPAVGGSPQALGKSPPAAATPPPGLGQAPPAVVNPPPVNVANASPGEPARVGSPSAPVMKHTVVGLAPPPTAGAALAKGSSSPVRVGASRPPAVSSRGPAAGPPSPATSSDSGARPLMGATAPVAASPVGTTPIVVSPVVRPSVAGSPGAGSPSAGSPGAVSPGAASPGAVSPGAGAAALGASPPALAATALAPASAGDGAVVSSAPALRPGFPAAGRDLSPPAPSALAAPPSGLPASAPVSLEPAPPEVAARVEAREGEGAALRRRTRRAGDTGEPQAAPIPLDGPQRAATASAFDALDLEPPASVARPRSNVRWVFALLLLAGVVGVMLVVGRNYLNKPRNVDAYDAQVDALLESGHALLGRGDIGGARRQFEQARELARDNPKVLTAELVLQGTVCDQSWLGLRLHPEESPEAAAARSALGDCSRELGTLTARARQVSPVPPELDAALVDAFRLQDDLAQARTHAVKLSQQATLPAAAYALGMLDVGDASPGWATVIDRLRLATSAERIPGRAHFALAYALTQSGDLEAARAELGKVKATSRPHPLTDRLEAVVEERATTDSAPETGEPSDKAALPSQPPPSHEAPPSQQGAPQTGSAPATDPMEAARAARAKGDLTAAERFYQQALQLDPGNVGALTGLGDVERGRGNKPAALSHYHAALRANGQHPPAIAGAADVLWSNGDRAEAVKYYRRIAPGNAFSARAQQRIAEFEGASREPAGSAPEKSGTATPKPEEPPEPAEESKAEEPEPEPVPVPRESPPSIPGPAPKDEP